MRDDEDTVRDEDALALCGDDAAAWAREFARVAGRLPAGAVDEDFVRGWFANAIERARTSQARRDAERRAADAADRAVAEALWPGAGSSAGGRFTRRGDGAVVAAVQWTDDNWREVKSWMEARGLRGALQRSGDDGREVRFTSRDGKLSLGCMPGGWFVEGSAVAALSRERFEQLYEPARGAAGAGATSVADLRRAIGGVPPGGASGGAPEWLVRLHRAACAAAGVEVRDSVAPPAVPTGQQLFVEKKPRQTISAVRWTGDNQDEVLAWLSTRAESAGIRPGDGPDAPKTVVASDADGAWLTCAAPGWFVEDRHGLVHTMTDRQFNHLYEPAPASAAEAPVDVDGPLSGLRISLRDDIRRRSELAQWREWARVVLTRTPASPHPSVSLSDGVSDRDLREKIAQMITASWVPSVPPKMTSEQFNQAYERAERAAESAVPGAWRVHRCAGAEADRACGIVAEYGAPASFGDESWVVSDTNRDECQHGMRLSDAERIVALHNADLTSRRARAFDASDFVVEACARVATDVYAAGLGGAWPSWDAATHPVRETARASVRAVFDGTTPEQWHARWKAEKEAEGWTWGPERDDERKQHPNLRPYRELPEAQRELDRVFAAAARATRRVVEEATYPLLVVRGPTSPEDVEQVRERVAQYRSAIEKLPRDSKIYVDSGSVEVVYPGIRDARQAEVAAWAARCFGTEEATSVPQRALRLLEEAIELAQASQVSRKLAKELVGYVYRRPVGEVAQEVGGLSVTLLAFAAAAGLSADGAERSEVTRVLSLPAEHFAERNARKNGAGLRMVGVAPAPGVVDVSGELDEYTRSVELMGRILVELFEEHCECRPTNTARITHSHDCDDDVTTDVRTFIHRAVIEDGELRAATNEEIADAFGRLDIVLGGRS